jgi:hypothetical protein
MMLCLQFVTFGRVGRTSSSADHSNDHATGSNVRNDDRNVSLDTRS